MAYDMTQLQHKTVK